MVDNPLRMDKLAHNQDIYRIVGKIAVDKVCRYETLSDDLDQVWARIGLPRPVELPRTKVGPARRPAAEEFTVEEARAGTNGVLCDDP